MRSRFGKLPQRRPCNCHQKKPQVSVVIPTYNQGEFIGETLDSLFAQTFRDFEIIVVDDGSTDDTRAIVTSYADPRIKYYRKQNGGTGSALNYGFKYATGRYETWFASDNVMNPDCLQALYAFLETHPQVDYVYANCDIRTMDATGHNVLTIRNLKDRIKQTWDANRLMHYYFLGIFWLWRRHIREQVGLFSTDLCEDYDYAVRMADAGVRFHFLDRNLGWFRSHQKNTSSRIARDGAAGSVQRRIVRDTRIRRFPKKAWFYWGSQTLPYLRYLTLETFCKFNPDWQVTLYRPKVLQTTIPWTSHEQRHEMTGPDYSDRLSRLPIRLETFDAGPLGLSNDLSEVHKSDFLRLWLLGREGGVWSDMDIVYFAPLNLQLDSDTYLCDHAYGHSIGLLASTPDNPVFHYLFEQAKLSFNPANYQSAGVVLFNKHRSTLHELDKKNTKYYPLLNKTICSLPMDTVYAYDATDIPAIHSPMKADKFTSHSIGCHWYAGHALSGAACNAITEHNWHDLDTVLGHAIQRALA